MRKHYILAPILMILILITSFSINPIVSSAKSYNWGFTKSTNGQPVYVGEELESVLKKHHSLYKGKPDKKVLYLTFDNGFENGYTESILDTLKKEKVPATFFLTGHYVESATDLVKRMIEDGHIIGNHSYGHPDMDNLSEEKMVAEWQKFDRVLKELTGVERTYYVRPPKGIFSEKLLEVGNKHGYRHIFWSIAFVDWDRNSTKSGDYAYNELMKQLHPGAIILMHTVARHNAEGLPKFIQEAKKQGYTFESLDNLLLDHALETKKQ